MDVPLYPNERIDDLLTQDLRIIQSEDVFAFSLDAVLLARFCSLPPRGKIADLCSGNGVIPLLLSTRTKAAVTAVEIQERLADMAKRNVLINDLQERIEVIQGDLKHVHERTGIGSFDVVTVNPPYLPVQNGEQNDNDHIAIARHEIHATLEDVVAACSRLVKAGGKVAMVHRPQRLIDIVATMRAYRIEPKRIRFVHPRAGAEANIVLIEGSKDGRPEVRLLPPLIVHTEAGNYTEELLDVYYGKASALREGGTA